VRRFALGAYGPHSLRVAASSHAVTSSSLSLDPRPVLPAGLYRHELRPAQDRAHVRMGRRAPRRSKRSGSAIPRASTAQAGTQ